MAALSAARNTPMMGNGEGTVKLTIPLKANAKVWQGGLVAIDNASGFGIAGAAATTNICAGIALQSVDNTGGSNGALSVDVICEAAFLLDCSGQAATILGRTVYFTDDHTVTNSSTGSAAVGVVTTFVSATQVWVYIGIPRVAGT
jgi:hypothetical protein